MPADILAALPLTVIAATAIVVLLMIAFRRNHLRAAVVTLLGHGTAFASLAAAATVVPRQITPLLIIDGYGLFFVALLLSASVVVSVLAYGYLQGRADNVEEFYVLQLLATLGAVVLVVSRHFVSLFLGLELLGVALYALIAYLHTDERPLEAGLKYLLLAGASAAFLLFGAALLYAELGTMAFDRVARLLAAGENIRSLFVLTGLAMTITGIAFKLAVVPFHMWTPDVYEGAPAPVAAFVATVSKGAVVALLLRYFVQADSIEAYRGLFWRRPALAMIFTATLLSLASIPLTAGFIGKVFVLLAGIQSALWPLVSLLVFTSAIGLVYYLRIVVALYAALPQTETACDPLHVPSLSVGGSIMLATLTIGLVWLGVYPAPLIYAIRLTVASLL